MLQLQRKKKAMKRIAIITTVFMLTAGLSAFAKEKNQAAIVTEKGIYQLSFSKIIVANDIDIRLSESTDRIIEISGDSKYSQQVEWKIKDGVLNIRSKTGSLKNKVVVSISVNQLSDLLITGNSDVKSEGALNSKELKVLFDGEGNISLKNTGIIRIERGDAIDMEVERVSGKVKVE